MPKKLSNWTFKNIERFLRANGFALSHTNGSHYYYRGLEAGIIRNVCVPFHGSNEPIKPRTVKSIIVQSGISIEIWTKE
jgi:predicted RNA binding protein YcfA (HicA-like mRNA interferase family)